MASVVGKTNIRKLGLLFIAWLADAGILLHAQHPKLVTIKTISSVDNNSLANIRSIQQDRFGFVWMSSARRHANPIAAHLDAVGVFVAEEVYASNVVEVVFQTVALPQPTARMVTHDQMLDAVLAP